MTERFSETNALYSFPKDVLILILQYIEQDTITKCKTDLEFLKSAFQNLDDSSRLSLIRGISNSCSSSDSENACWCHSDEFCEICDD